MYRDFDHKNHNIIYSCCVDVSQSGSFVEHIVGITEAAILAKFDITIWSTCRRDENESLELAQLKCQKWIFRFFNKKLFNYLCFDLLGAVKLFSLDSNNTILYVRPNLSSFLQLGIAKILGFNVILEVNGIASEELKVKGKWYYRLVRILEIMQIQLATSAICVSEGIAKFYAKSVSTPLKVVSNGCRITSITDEPRRLVVRDKVHLGFIGSLVPWQGLKEFLILLSSYSNKGRVVVHIYGSGVLEDELKCLSKELDVDCRFYGWVESSKIADKLKSVHIGLLPRLNQGPSGSPLKLFKYVSMGMPVLTTNSDGIAELECLNDVLCKFDYAVPDSLYQVLNQVMAHEIILSDLSQKTLIIAKEHLTWSKVLDKIIFEE